MKDFDTLSKNANSKKWMTNRGVEFPCLKSRSEFTEKKRSSTTHTAIFVMMSFTNGVYNDQ